MVTTIAGGLLCIGCTASGLLVRRHYVARRDFAKQLVVFLESLKSRIAYLKTPLLDYADEVAGQDCMLKPILEEYCRTKRAGERFTVRAELLKEEEQKELQAFFDGVGKSDLPTTLDSLEHYCRYFAEVARLRAEEATRLGGMYFKLLTLLGVALLVIVA